MKLSDLDPKFVRCSVEKAHPSHGRPLPDGTMQWGGFDVDTFTPVPTLAEADGIVFDCPKCFAANDGPVGTHGVRTFFAGRGVPDRLGTNKKGETVRWNVAGGHDFTDLTLTPSILIEGGCGWHGFVTNGEAN